MRKGDSRIMMKKTIWIVNEYNFPDAVKSRQTNLCRLLNERGYDCYIISGSSDNKGGSNRVKGKEKLKYVETDEAKGYIIRTPNYHNSYERVVVSLLFQHRTWVLRKHLPNPDVIISDFAGLFGNCFLKWKKKYSTKIIFDILDLWPEGFIDLGHLSKTSPIAKVLYSMEHKSYREADGIIFSFQGGRNYIIDKGWSMEVGGDVDTSNIGYLNNGVDLDAVDEQKNKYVFEDSDLDSEKFKFVYLGSISEFNGLEVLVEAARLLQKRNINNVIILVYGYGNQEEQLRRMVSDYGLNNIVFKGKVDKKYAMSLLTKSDVNLFTFKNTPLLKYGVSPNKLFMYFASGKPVLSMIQPAFDLVKQNNAGISVNNIPEEIANVMVNMSNLDMETYQLYCENSRRLAEQYDYKYLVNVLIEHIERKN